nr:MAG TPA: hypothetical protein [Caudoviricetes sp.]
MGSFSFAQILHFLLWRGKDYRKGMKVKRLNA